MLAAAPLWAAGPPPASFPERFAAPATDAERDADCDRYEHRVRHTRKVMARSGPLSRVGWFRIRHRKLERYLKEYCGHADEHDFEISHRSVATGVRPPIASPAITGWDHPVHWYLGGHGGDQHASGHQGSVDDQH